MRDQRCICPNDYSYFGICPVHGTGCTCQYGDTTPRWYICTKTCPIHAAEYDPMQAPEWAATSCGEGGKEVWRDRGLIVAKGRVTPA